MEDLALTFPYENKTLRVLPAKERGAPSTPMLSETGKTIFIEIPHFPAEDLITPKDPQDILAVAGRTKRHITLEEEVAKWLLSLRNTHAITREWVRTSALQGIITDGNGSTVYNLNTVFGIVPTVIDFVLGTPATDVIGLRRRRWIRRHGVGECQCRPDRAAESHGDRRLAESDRRHRSTDRGACGRQRSRYSRRTFRRASE